MSLARRILLAASTNPWIRDRAMKAPFVMRSVSRFMPGERIEDAVAAASRLRREGIATILTHLGENLTTRDEAEGVTRHYLDALDRIEAADLDAQVSVKPTQLGLDLDEELCRRNLDRLADAAAARGRLLWIDMENARYVDRTLQLFRSVRARTPLVGLALQAYLYRTERDVEELAPLGAALRLVKGAYLESPAVAYPKKADVDENYFRLARRILQEHHRPGAMLHVATHDAALIARVDAHLEAANVPRAASEYAMLYGIQVPLQRQLVSAGHRVRVLISYGAQWFPWYMRRLAERPANVGFVLRSLIGGGR